MAGNRDPDRASAELTPPVQGPLRLKVGGLDGRLILDVSRWGRFQGPDESADSESLRRKVGVQMTYGAEPFADDRRRKRDLMHKTPPA